MKWFTYLLFFLFASRSYGQNLVHNPSFETYINCPAGGSSIVDPSGTPLTVQDWFRPTLGTSDYMNACSPGTVTSVPVNFRGWQMAHEGNAYIGAFVLGVTQYLNREYVQSRLTMPMIAGHEYYVSFWVSLAESSPGPLVAADQIGAYFDANYVYSIGSTQLDFLTPQILNPPGNVLDDTSSWMRVEGTFTASGGEQCIVIGNFSSFANQSVYPVVGSAANFILSYYYIDDVCVFDMSPMLATHDTVICKNGQLMLSGKDNMHSYIWNTGDTSKNILITQPGTYWVKTFGDCIAGVDTYHVALKQTPTPLASDTTLCAGTAGPVLLRVEGTDIRWYLPDNNNGSPNQPGINTNQPGTYTFYLTQTIEGCESDKIPVHVRVLNKPVADLQDAALCLGEALEIGKPQEGVSFQWNTGATSCCLTINEPGTYHLRVYNDCGEQEDEAVIGFYDCMNCLWVPSAFSPNADGLNDEFEVKALCPLKKYTIKIFNRWGQRAFSSNDPTISWDGKFNDAPCDVGTYFYQLEAEAGIGNSPSIKLKGELTLIK